LRRRQIETVERRGRQQAARLEAEKQLAIQNPDRADDLACRLLQQRRHAIEGVIGEITDAEHRIDSEADRALADGNRDQAATPTRLLAKQRSTVNDRDRYAAQHRYAANKPLGTAERLYRQGAHRLDHNV
jgi:hypothetical protein